MPSAAPCSTDDSFCRFPGSKNPGLGPNPAPAIATFSDPTVDLVIGMPSPAPASGPNEDQGWPEPSSERSPAPERASRLQVLRIDCSQSLESVISLSSWIGYVTAVQSDSFHAVLESRTPGVPDAEADFEFDQVPPGDLELIEEGAPFYWSIAYANHAGQRRTVSELHFRRLADPDRL